MFNRNSYPIKKCTYINKISIIYVYNTSCELLKKVKKTTIVLHLNFLPALDFFQAIIGKVHASRAAIRVASIYMCV